MGYGFGAIQGWLGEARTTYAANAARLDELDAAIGDGDHGTNMARGFDAAATMDFATHDTPQLLLKQVGMQLLGTIGGAAGALYGTFFLTVAAQWPTTPNTPRLAKTFRAARDAVQSRGRAEVGDKTMVDALDAAVKSMDSEDDDAPLGEALTRAAEAAKLASAETKDMVARRGRAALLGERSVGHVDPGAESAALLFEITARHLG